MKVAIWILAAASGVSAQELSMDQIMGRVAANQALSVEARKLYVYRQEELFSLHKGNGKVACESRREYNITPSATGIVKHVVQSQVQGDGSCQMHDDGGTTESVSDIAGNGHSADGIPHDLFPLTAGQQSLYSYRMEGLESYRGRKVYRISFQPNHARDADGDEGYWKGETLIDAEEFQPLLVTTDLTAKIPLAVRVLLGTNVRGVGFTVSYQRMADGVWFPASFGGEFDVHALFFIRRSVSINVKNSDFRRADVVSNLAFDSDKQ